MGQTEFPMPQTCVRIEYVWKKCFSKVNFDRNAGSGRNPYFDRDLCFGRNIYYGRNPLPARKPRFCGKCVARLVSGPSHENSTFLNNSCNNNDNGAAKTGFCRRSLDLERELGFS